MSNKRMWAVALVSMCCLVGVARADDVDQTVVQDPEREQEVARLRAVELERQEALAHQQQELLEDQEIIDREDFLETRLQKGARNSTLWQVVWATGYGLGFLVQTTRAVTESQTSVQADLVVSLSKAAVGVVSRLARPPNAMYGTRDLVGLPSNTRLERQLKLAKAEALLRRNAKECDARYSWIAHTVNIALNLAGGLIVWLGYNDLQTAATSTAIGLAVGELQIWSQPWQPKKDWAEYKRRFGSTAYHATPPPARRSLVLVPALGRDQLGGALRLSF